LRIDSSGNVGISTAYVIKKVVGPDKKVQYYIEGAGHPITNKVDNLKDAEKMLKKQIEFGDGRFRNYWHLLK
jgi:hypothetical protein